MMQTFAEQLFSEFDYNNIHAKNHEYAIVMYSGGLDSTVSLWWAMTHYKNVRVLTVNYNQPHSIELRRASQILTMVDLPHREITVDIPSDFWGIRNHLTRGQACFMTSIAALDIGHEGADIIHGILVSDAYGDCDRNFQDSLADVLFHEQDFGKIGIATPLRAVKTKADVIALGLYYGAPINLSWTCRNPQNGQPCHECLQCRAREIAFQSFYEKYAISPQEYAAWTGSYGSPNHPVFQEPSRDLKIVFEAAKELGILNQGDVCLSYKDPFGSNRVASNIRRLRKLDRGMEWINTVSVCGELENHMRWEVCFCADGRIAYTDILPSIDVIEQALIKKIR